MRNLALTGVGLAAGVVLFGFLGWLGSTRVSRPVSDVDAPRGRDARASGDDADLTLAGEPSLDGGRDAAVLAASAPAPADVAPALPAAEAERLPVDSDPLGDPVGCLVFGQVKVLGGALPESTGVRLLGPDGEELRISCDARGSFACSGLARGTWLFAVRGPRLRPLERWVELEAVGRATRVDLVVDPAPGVLVRALAPDGRPFLAALLEVDAVPYAPDCRVLVARDAASLERRANLTREPAPLGLLVRNAPQGVVLPAEYLGRLDLRADPPLEVGLLVRDRLVAQARIEPGADEVTLVADPSEVARLRPTLRLRVADGESGEPIEGAEVALDASGFHSMHSLTDAEGHVEIPRVEPGERVITVDADGRGTLRLPIHLRPAEVHNLGDVLLGAPTEITGRLRDPEGRPVAGEMQLGVEGPDGRRTWLGAIRRAGDDGVFRIRGLAAGDYVLRPSSGELRGRDARVSTRTGSRSAVSLEVEAVGSVVVRCKDASGERSLFAELVDPGGHARASRAFAGSRQVALSAPVGAWTLVVKDAAGRVLLERSVRLGLDPLRVAVPAD